MCFLLLQEASKYMLQESIRREARVGWWGYFFFSFFFLKALQHKILLEPRGSIVSLAVNGWSCFSDGASRRSLAKSCELRQKESQSWSLRGRKKVPFVAGNATACFQILSLSCCWSLSSSERSKVRRRQRPGEETEAGVGYKWALRRA